ncbi:hypothetical protein BU16DRAFT_583753 [Lophium mytilinum]|uniref:F-box domain-containing protein n=1 Tax=Lophium mytilinum TaxID=390894 RepID=A0A6A6QK50_9PEZI|nr:hypothetical protein BU16DRAFT_583753 [Lophium mytilinum]
MSFSDLPIELLFETASYLDDRSMSRLSRVCGELHMHLRGELHNRAIADRLVGWYGHGPRQAQQAIEWAVDNSKKALVRYLLSCDVTGIDPRTGNWDVFDRATLETFGDIDITTLFVNKAAELGLLAGRRATDVLDRIVKRMSAGWRHLHIDHSINSVVRVLLEAGVDPNQCSNEYERPGKPGCPPFDLAVHGRYFETAMTLLQFDPSLAVKPYRSGRGKLTRPLDEVVKMSSYYNPKGQLKFIRKVIELGAEVLGSHLDCALMPLWDGKGEMLTLLLEHGADPEKPDVNGRNFLQRSTLNKDFRHELRILTQVATKKKWPRLIPGEVILRNAERCLHRMQMIPKTRGNVSEGFRHAKEVLAYVWEPLEEVVRTFEPDEFPFAAEIHHLWDQHHIEVEGCLGESVTLMSGFTLIMSITAAATALPPLPTAPFHNLCIGDDTYPTTCTIRQNLIANGSCASYNQLQYCCNGGLIDSSQALWPLFVAKAKNISIELPNLRCCLGDPFRALGDTTTCGEGQQEIPLTEAVNGGSDGWRESAVTSWTDSYGLEVEPVCIWMAESVEGGSASLPLSGKGCTKAIVSTTLSEDIFTTSESSGTSSTVSSRRIISASASHSSTTFSYVRALKQYLRLPVSEVPLSAAPKLVCSRLYHAFYLILWG